MSAVTSPDMQPRLWQPDLGLSPETVDYVQAVIGLQLLEANDGLQDKELCIPGLTSVEIDALAFAHMSLWNPGHLTKPLLELAEQSAALRAVSYREFNVGAGAVFASISPGEKPRIGIFVGANYTPYEGAPKRCAEMEIIAKARDAGFDKLIAMTVFGPTEFKDVQELDSATLHPCEPCRTLLDASPAVEEDSALITANARALEPMTMRQLMTLHGSATPQLATSA